MLFSVHTLSSWVLEKSKADFNHHIMLISSNEVFSRLTLPAHRFPLR